MWQSSQTSPLLKENHILTPKLQIMWVKLLLLVTASSCAAAFGFGGDAAFGYKLANKKYTTIKSAAAVQYGRCGPRIETCGFKRLEASMETTSKNSNPLKNIMQSTVPLFLVCLGMASVDSVPNFCVAEQSTSNTGRLIFDTRCIKSRVLCNWVTNGKLGTS